MNISYSQYSTYKNCPLKFKLVYHDKLSSEDANQFTIHSIFGTALHETLQKYLTIFYNDTISTADEFDVNLFLQESMVNQFKEYNNTIKENTSPEILMSYYNDGVEILSWFKKHRNDYFSKKGIELKGCEIELLHEIRPNLCFHGYIDIVIYDKNNNTYHIIDFKKSSRGWGDREISSPLKRLQLQLYKYYYSKQFNVPLDNINISFMIFKQKIYMPKDLKFIPKRIQIVTPPSSERTLSKIISEFETDIDKLFINGEYNKDMEFNPISGNCGFCEFLNTEYCTVGK